MNLILLLILAIVNFLLLALTYKLFGKKGLLTYIVISVVAANIQVNKLVEFDLGFVILTSTLGNVMFGGVFLATDLLNENYGAKTAQQSVYLSIFMNMSFIIVMFISTLFVGISESTEINDSMHLLFSLNGGVLKAVIVGNIVYFISQSLDVFVYDKIRNMFSSDKYLFLRNNGSTFISQIVDSILISIGFMLVGIFPSELVVSITLTTIIIKLFISLLDTPFLYIMKKIEPMNDER